MNNYTPAITKENEALTRQLETLQMEFIDLFTSHKYMVENESDILTSLCLEKIGRLQLELLEKRTGASKLNMKIKLIQAAINRNEKPDLVVIEKTLYERLTKYYAEIEAQSAAVEQAGKLLSHLIPVEDSLKLKEVFRLLCKRLHPDLNPHQTEQEKDFFVKMKAAYDLYDLKELQKILLYLDESRIEQLSVIPKAEKIERIHYLTESIASLKDKIACLKTNFPFNMKELIFDEEYVSKKQEEIKQQIRTFEDEIEKYTNIIYLMTS
jgi:hypothetical protein